MNSNFLFDTKRAWEFIREVKSRNIKKRFICYLRADFIAENEDVIKALCEIGFTYFLVGLEAICDKELDDYNKRITLEVNEKCIEVVKNYGARIIALMIAPIDATKQYFSDLYEYVVKHDLKYVTVSIFTPIPGTPLFDEYKDRLITNNIEDWDFLHLVVKPENMSKREFYFEFYKLTYKLYRIAKKSGFYDFIDLEYYKDVVKDYFRQKVREFK